MQKDIFMTTDQVADRLGVSKSCLVKWRRENRGPEFIQKGYKTITYKKADVEAFAKEFNYD